jgi:antirestriction protein ArdC
MKQEHADRIAAKFIEQLAKGTVPWRKPWSPVAGVGLHNYYSKRPYRGINTLLLGIEQIEHGYTSPAWTTFKAAADKGAYVRKGEKGTTVVFWKPIKVTDKETGEDKRIFLTRLYTVFNTDQIDGIDYQAPEPTEPIAVPDALAGIYHSYEGAPEIIHRAQDRAFYSPSVDQIVLPTLDQFDTVEGYAETYCHELVHSTGHPSRLDRFAADHGQCTQDYAREELVAEIGASLLAQQAGITLDIAQSAAYVASWLKALQDDHSLIVTAAQKAQRAVDLITGVVPARAEEGAEEREPVSV